MSLQEGTGLRDGGTVAAAASAASGPTLSVGDAWSDLPASPSDGERCYLRDHLLLLCYLSGLGSGMWVPESLVTGEVGSEALSSDVDTLLWAPEITGFANGAALTTWANLGSGGDYTAAGAEAPTYGTTSGVGSGPGVTCTTDDVMVQTSPSLLRNETAAVVATLWQPAFVNPTHQILWEVGTSDGTEERLRLYVYSATGAHGRVNDTDVTESIAVNNSPAAPVVGTWMVPTATWSAAGVGLSVSTDSLSVNGTDFRASFGAGGVLSDDTAPAHVAIMGSPTDNLHANGVMVGAVAIKSTLATQLERVRRDVQAWFEAYAGVGAA